jgi:hypothetical protein
VRQLARIAAIWGAALAAALLIAWQTRVGPIVLRVTDRHGVHLGDVAAFEVCAMWALHGTIGPFRARRRRVAPPF